MHMFLQQIQVSPDVVTDIINKTFHVTPTTIYGLLLLFLAMSVVLLVMAVNKLWKITSSTIKEKDKQIIDLNTSTIEVLKDLEKILDAVQNSTDKYTIQILEAIKDAKHDIGEKILLLENNLTSKRK